MHSVGSAPWTVAAAAVGNTHIHRGTGTHAARTHTDAHYSKHAGFARLLLPRQPVACSLRFLTSIKG